MTELASQVSITTSGATRIVDRIEEAGYVRRQDCKSDRRVSYVVLTDAGRDAVEKAQPVYERSVMEYLTARLGPADLESLAKLVGKLHG